MPRLRNIVYMHDVENGLVLGGGHSTLHFRGHLGDLQHDLDPHSHLDSTGSHTATCYTLPCGSWSSLSAQLWPVQDSPRYPPSAPPLATVAIRRSLHGATAPQPACQSSFQASSETAEERSSLARMASWLQPCAVHRSLCSRWTGRLPAALSDLVRSVDAALKAEYIAVGPAIPGYFLLRWPG